MALHANKIHRGDCIKQLSKIDPGSVDLVFADPPFNIGYDYDVYDDARASGEYLQFSRDWMSGVWNALKPSGTFWLAIGDEYAAELKLVAQNDVGFTCRSWVIWYYTFGVNCVRGFSRSHTHLFHFVKDPNDFTFNGQNPAVRVASARQLVYADARGNSSGRLPDNTWILRPQDAPASGFQPMHDTWFYSRVAGTFKEREGFHGCQMPEQLLGRIIRTSSKPGDLVVDPFGGSGTTLAVAKKLGRRWMGIELSKDYVKRIKKRLDECNAGDPLDGVEDPVRSAPKTSKGKKRTKFRNGRPVTPLTEETEAGIIDAYSKACDGQSTDVVLCEPELNDGFVKACKANSVAGDATAWNRLLLRIRKSGKLPKANKSPRKLSPTDLDQYNAGSEAALQLLSLDYGLTLDDILCSPLAAKEFDNLAQQYAPGFTPFEYRWAAMAIRKRASRAKAYAVEQVGDWLTKELPDPTPLKKAEDVNFEGPGVYVVEDRREPIYIGETLHVRARIDQMQASDSWLLFAPKRIRFLEASDQSLRYGLQSILIGRFKPVLNTSLLRPEDSNELSEATVAT